MIDLDIEESTTKLTLALSPWLIRWGNMVMRNLQISGCSYRTALWSRVLPARSLPAKRLAFIRLCPKAEILVNTVADTVFPRGALTYFLAHLLPKTAWKWKRNGLRRLERTQPANLGVLTYYLAIFSPKAAWKWKKLDGKEGGAAHPPSPIRQCYTFSRAAHCLYFIFMEVFGKII